MISTPGGILSNIWIGDSTRAVDPSSFWSLTAIINRNIYPEVMPILKEDPVASATVTHWHNPCRGMALNMAV